MKFSLSHAEVKSFYPHQEEDLNWSNSAMIWKKLFYF